MASTEGRFARSERQWDCRHGTPRSHRSSQLFTFSWVFM